MRSRKLAAVQRHEVEAGTEAAHGDGAAFAVDTVDGYTGDTLQRLGEVGVRELADVFGRNGVDDAGRVALGLHRSLQASTQARDHHFLEFTSRLILCEYRVDQHCTTHDGEQCLRTYRQCLWVEFHIRRLLLRFI